MKRRDVEVILRNRGMERGTYDVLCKMADEITDLQQAMKEMVQLFDTMSRVVGTTSVVQEGMRLKFDQLQRRTEGEE